VCFEIEISVKPTVCFGFQFSTCKILLPNYCDLYLGSRETEFERLTNNPERIIVNLTHEYLHGLIFEITCDKTVSLNWDNIDKGYGKDGEFYRISES
jgi:hypothetical protein